MAINGFGRIGRAYLRGLRERGLLGGQVEVVAVNDLWPPATLAHLLAYDSTFGRLRADVSHDQDACSRGTGCARCASRTAEIPWADLAVDLVIEATGRFRGRADAGAHLNAGAGRVLISAPGKDVDATLVVGVNHTTAIG